MTVLVDRISASDALLACSTLGHIDHVDVHGVRTTTTAGDPSPEEWAREILEATSPAMRVRLRTGWTMLGIKLRNGKPDTIAGWTITHNDADYVRLQGDSRIGLTGQLVTRKTAEGIEFATCVQLSNPAARTIWARALPTHLRIVESLLRQAAERRAG